MSNNDRDLLFMKRALELAALGKGYVKTNPLVGAVLVYNNHIIGEGYHEKFGAAHAEVNAVNSVPATDRGLIKGSVLYASLEPCFHFGKTPPCVDLILKERIPKVVIACIDPNPKVSSKSVEKLRAAGVEVIIGVGEKEGKELIKPFIKNINLQAPYVILKWAQSADGFIGKKDKYVWISNDFTRRLSHKWRAESDAVMVGAQTARTDDPQLDHRYYFGAAPVRISFDKDRSLPLDARLLDQSAPTLIFTNFPEPVYSGAQTRFFSYPLSVTDLLRQLYAENIGALLVEGGAQLINAFIIEELWDEARVFHSPVILSEGIAAPLISYSLLKKTARLDDNKILYYRQDP